MQGSVRGRKVCVEASGGQYGKYMRVFGVHACGLPVHCCVAIAMVRIPVAQGWPRSRGVLKFVVGLLYRRS